MNEIQPDTTMPRPRFSKTMRMLVTQTGTDAPTAILLQNDFPWTFTWTRAGAGIYLLQQGDDPDGILRPAFGDNQIVWMNADNPTVTGNAGYNLNIATEDGLILESQVAGTPNDNLLTRTPVEITIYKEIIPQIDD